jgi:serine/threonine protein kinase
MYKTLKAGKKLGKGNSGIVYTIKDKYNAILHLMKSGVTDIILYYKNTTEHLDIDQFDSFKEFIESLDDTHVCKYFYIKNANHKFHNEIDGYKHALKSNTSNKIKVGNFGVKYKSKILLGFILVYPTSKKHFTIMEKCDLDLKKCILNDYFKEEEEFRKLITEILYQLIQIQKLNIAHGDIKLDNIMKCNGQYKLIDWGYMRELNYDDLKNSKKPVLGSCSLYFKIYADGHKGYVNNVPWKTAYKISSQVKFLELSVQSYITNKSTHYLHESNKYYNEQYKLYDGEELFDHLKYGLDLHAFGWLLYDILIYTDYASKYKDFIMNLYKSTPKKALDDFKKL